MVVKLLSLLFLFSLLFTASWSYSTTPTTLNEGLVIHLPFDGSADDVAGGGHNGIVSGATLTEDRHGNADSAYYFDGNDYITVATDGSVLEVNIEGWTLSLWVKPDEGQASAAAPIASYGYGKFGGYCVDYWEAYGMYRGLFYAYDWDDIYLVAKDEQDYYLWHLLTITYDGETLKEYVNGVLVDEEQGGYYPTSRSYSLRFGTDSAGVSTFFKGAMDDVRIYDRALTEIEIAHMSELSGVVRAVELGAYSLADFEWNRLDPVKVSHRQYVWGNNGNAYTEVVENPRKEGLNTSNYVAVSHTFPSLPPPDSTDCDKSEYVLTTPTGEGFLTDQHHIMRWKILFNDDNIINIEEIVWTWMSFNQIHAGAAKYPNGPGTTATDDTIAYGGGIFNDLKKASGDDPSLYNFRYRAIPDEALVPFQIETRKWMSFTYEILWTQSNSGFWRVYKDGKLLASADNVKTLPDSYDPAEDDFLHFKTGLYNKWNDPVINRLSMYFDDIELYIGDDIRVEDVCPECRAEPANSSGTLPAVYHLLLGE